MLKTAECEQPGQEEAQQELLGGLCTRLKSLEEQLSALAGGRALNIDQKASVELCRRELAYSVMSRQELCAEVSSRDWGGRRSAPAASAASAAMAASLSQWDSICRDSILQIPLAVDAAVDSALGDGSTPSSSSSEYDSGDYSSSFGSSGSEEEEEEEEEDQRGESAARGDEDEDSDEGGSGSMLMSGGSDADSDADNDADSDADNDADNDDDDDDDDDDGGGGGDGDAYEALLKPLTAEQQAEVQKAWSQPGNDNNLDVIVELPAGAV